MEPEGHAPAVSRPTVLVADDSDVVRDAVRRHLGEAGYVTIEASDGAEALALARSHEPDVILLDVQMPVLDGYQVLDALKQDEDLATIPVVFLSVRNSVREIAEALTRGAHDYLPKPFQPIELVARVRGAARVRSEHLELRRRTAELEAFAVRASHDLKSPLTVIRGISEALARYWDRIGADERQQLLDRLDEAVDRSTRMISDLLQLAKAGSETAIDAVTHAPLDVAKSVVASAPVSVDDDVSVDGSDAPIRIDEADLRSILGNLVDNAHHYGRGVDGRLHLRLGSSVSDGLLRLDVSDGGPGIPTAEAERIFEPFVSLPGSLEKNPASSGVGLAIVRKIAERWGGRVSLVRVDASGASFVLVLPLA